MKIGNTPPLSNSAPTSGRKRTTRRGPTRLRNSLQQQITQPKQASDSAPASTSDTPSADSPPADSSPGDTPSQAVDFTNMTRSELFDWMNARVSDAGLSNRDSMSLVALTLEFKGDVPGMSSELNFIEMAQQGPRIRGAEHLSTIAPPLSNNTRYASLCRALRTPLWVFFANAACSDQGSAPNLDEASSGGVLSGGTSAGAAPMSTGVGGSGGDPANTGGDVATGGIDSGGIGGTGAVHGTGGVDANATGGVGGTGTIHGTGGVGGTGGGGESGSSGGAGSSSGGGTASGGETSSGGGAPEETTISWGTTLQPPAVVDQARTLASSLLDSSAPNYRASGDQHRSYRFPEADREVPYRLSVPTDWDGSSELPLAMFLHGAGANESTYLDQNGALIIQLAEEHDYILVSPLGLDGAYGSYLRLPAVFGEPEAAEILVAAKTAETERTQQLSEQDVINVLEIVLAEYPVDRQNMFLMGHSMGSGGTWYLGGKYAFYWNAIAPLSGPFVQESVYPWERIREIPIFVTEGLDTPSLDGSRAVRDWLEENEFTYEYLEVPADHGGMVPLVLPDIFDFFDRMAE